MAVIYRCDRCHSEFNKPEKLFMISLPILNYHGEITDDDNYIRGLCGSCCKLVIELVKELPKVSKA